MVNVDGGGGDGPSDHHQLNGHRSANIDSCAGESVHSLALEFTYTQVHEHSSGRILYAIFLVCLGRGARQFDYVNEPCSGQTLDVQSGRELVCASSVIKYKRTTRAIPLIEKHRFQHDYLLTEMTIGAVSDSLLFVVFHINPLSESRLSECYTDKWSWPP